MLATARAPAGVVDLAASRSSLSDEANFFEQGSSRNIVPVNTKRTSLLVCCLAFTPRDLLLTLLEGNRRSPAFCAFYIGC